jgi:hypothetical protein
VVLPFAEDKGDIDDTALFVLKQLAEQEKNPKQVADAATSPASPAPTQVALPARSPRSSPCSSSNCDGNGADDSVPAVSGGNAGGERAAMTVVVTDAEAQTDQQPQPHQPQQQPGSFAEKGSEGVSTHLRNQLGAARAIVAQLKQENKRQQQRLSSLSTLCALRTLRWLRSPRPWPLCTLGPRSQRSSSSGRTRR